MAPIDLVLLVVILLSMAIGLMRGLLFEVLSLLGWVITYVAAQALTPLVAPRIPLGSPGSGVNSAAAFVVTFVVVLIVWGLLIRVLRGIVRASQLNALDRSLGALFGCMRGVVILLAVATVVAMTPLGHSLAWQQSRGASWLNGVLKNLKPLLPFEVARHLPS